MNTIAHLVAGNFLTKFLIKLEDDPEIYKNEKSWIHFGLFCSQLPDIDEIIGVILNVQKRHEAIYEGSDHHGALLHLPLLYFSIFFFFKNSLKIFNKNKVKSFLDDNRLFFAYKIFTANIVAHLIMDSLGFGQGLRWLYPFRKKQLGIYLTNKIGPQDWKEFYTSPRVGFEILVYLLSGLEFFWEKYKLKKRLS